MRLATYRGPDGNPRAGAVVGEAGDERIVDLDDATGGSVPAGDLLALLGAGPAALAAARARSRAGTGGRPLGDVELLRTDQATGQAAGRAPATSRRTSRRAAASASTRP